MLTARKPHKMHVAIVYKNFAIHAGISHIGLGVAALNNAKVLERHGIKTTVLPINTAKQLIDKMKASEASGKPFTHVVVSAPWISIEDMSRISQEFPFTEFFVNSHSNVGFLQADPNALKLIRGYIDLELGQLNFHIAGNSKKFVMWLREAYQTQCAYLPNMYFLDYSHKHNRPPYSDGGVLRIGAFGAIRPQKNIMTAAAAAISISNTIKADVEFWLSGGRAEGGGQTIVNAVKEMLVGVPGIKMMVSNWSSWPQFRDVIRRMHLLMQVSYTESFNMVTADGIAEGVPSVVSDAIDWVPHDWIAHFDNAEEVARVGRRLIYDRYAVVEGSRALDAHNRHAFHAWITALKVENCSYKSHPSDPYLLS